MRIFLVSPRIRSSYVNAREEEADSLLSSGNIPVRTGATRIVRDHESTWRRVIKQSIEHIVDNFHPRRAMDVN